MIQPLQFLVLLSLLTGLITPVCAREFVHPGGLHTQEDLERMKNKVAAKEHPWIDGWEALTKDRKARNDYRPAPHRHMGSRQRAQDDATAAYLNALRWYISGDESHAECSMNILNSWANTVNEVPRGPDQPGLSGIPIGSFALAAEVLRTYPGWSDEDQAKFKEMLVKYFYPVCHDFLTNHNGAADDKWWANWDTCNMLALIAIGVYCDDEAIFDEAIEYFKNGKGRGSIMNAVPFVHEGGLGQWQESGRDQAHVMGGMGLLAEMCQVAWNQGVDLFGYADNRLLAGAEYTAQYTLWKGVPYTYYTNSDGADQYYISRNYRGRLHTSHFEMLYNHYVVRQGLEAPHVRKLAELRRPEPGEIDVFGYGTLAFTLDADKSSYPAMSAPPTPLDLRATSGVGRVDLRWSPSGAYTTHGHEVFRATSEGGTYKSIHANRDWTTPAYTDTDVEPGTTYFYKVAARNNSGQSDPSEPVSATPRAAGDLPQGWTAGKAGARFSDAAGKTFVVHAAPGDESYTYAEIRGDFTLTARLIDRRGKLNLAGIMMRESVADDAPFAAMTTGEYGGRLARFRTRSETGGRVATHDGSDYTWPPVWFRIQRAGDAFSGYQSIDGIEWFQIGESEVSMPENMLVGFLAAGEEEDPEGNATFSQASGEVRPPSPPAAPEDLTSTVASDHVQLAWRNSTEGETAGIKVEASIDGAPFYESTDLPADATRFTNTGLTEPAGIRYRVRAYNRGGYSAYSNTTPRTTPRRGNGSGE